MWPFRDTDKKFLEDFKKYLIYYYNFLVENKYISFETYSNNLHHIERIQAFTDIKELLNHARRLHEEIKSLIAKMAVWGSLPPPKIYAMSERLYRDWNRLLARAQNLKTPLAIDMMLTLKDLSSIITFAMVYNNNLNKKAANLVKGKLGFIPDALFDSRFRRFNTPKEFFRQLKQRIQLVQQYFKEVGLTYYTKKIINENFWNFENDERIYNRLRFMTGGGILIPLGGRFKTKILVRIITKGAYNGWKKAQDAGIPVEEIVRAYPAKNGMVRVFCRYEGERLSIYAREHPNRRHELNTEKLKIIEQLQKLKIPADTNDSNFTVKEENGRLIVRIIDFNLFLL